MMKCQKCGNNEANTHYQQNINGKTTEMWLCSDCAEELGIGGMFSGFGGFGGMSAFGNVFDELLGTMFGLPSIGVKTAQAAVSAPDRCPGCGSTFGDIAKRGKAGCPECYTHFAEQLAPTIERLHGRRISAAGQQRTAQRTPERGRAAERTTGSGAAAKSTVSENAAKITELRGKLKTAIEAEEYEKAAVIRDEIKKLEA